jgi:hypothetical protein
MTLGQRNLALWCLLAVALPLGCARAARDDELMAEVQSLRAESAAERARVASLEQKLSDLEQQRSDAARQNEVLRKLERLVELNEQLLKRGQPAVPATAEAPAADATSSPLPSDASFSTRAEGDQLNETLERLRSMPLSDHGPMSLERRQALKVLLRRERPLDTQNPWATPR